MARELVRLEVVERSLASASKLFVAAIPLSIIISAVVPGADNFGDSLVNRLGLTGAGAGATRNLFATKGEIRDVADFARKRRCVTFRSEALPITSGRGNWPDETAATGTPVRQVRTPAASRPSRAVSGKMESVAPAAGGALKAPGQDVRGLCRSRDSTEGAAG